MLSITLQILKSAFVNEPGTNVTGELVNLLMTENMEQPQEKGGLRYCTGKGRQQKVVVMSTNDQSLSYKLPGSSHVDHQVTDLSTVETGSEKCNPGRQQERCSPGCTEGWGELEERLSHFLLQSKYCEHEAFSA